MCSPVPGTAHKTLGILSDRVRGASFVTHNKPLSTILEFMHLENGGLVARETNQVIRGLEPSAPSLTSGGREGVWILS